MIYVSGGYFELQWNVEPEIRSVIDIQIERLCSLIIRIVYDPRPYVKVQGCFESVVIFEKDI